MKLKGKKRYIVITLIVLVIFSTNSQKKTHSSVGENDTTDFSSRNSVAQKKSTSRSTNKNNNISQKQKTAPEKCKSDIGKEHEVKKDFAISDFRNKDISQNPLISDMMNINWTAPKLQLDKIRPQSKLGNFYLALSYAQMLAGSSSNKNFNEAKSILKEIIKSDPDNSYPLYFLAAVYQKENRNKKAKEVLAMALSIKSYKSYMHKFTRELYKLTIADPKDYILGRQLYNKIAIPDIKSRLDLFHISSRASEDLGHKMTRAAIRNKGEFALILWDTLEHDVGLKLLRKANSPDSDRILNSKEYIRRNNENSFYFSDSDCRKSFKEFLRREKEDFLNHLKENSNY